MYGRDKSIGNCLERMDMPNIFRRQDIVKISFYATENRVSFEITNV